MTPDRVYSWQGTVHSATIEPEFMVYHAFLSVLFKITTARVAINILEILNIFILKAILIF